MLELAYILIVVLLVAPWYVIPRASALFLSKMDVPYWHPVNLRELSLYFIGRMCLEALGVVTLGMLMGLTKCDEDVSEITDNLRLGYIAFPILFLLYCFSLAGLMTYVIQP